MRLTKRQNNRRNIHHQCNRHWARQRRQSNRRDDNRCRYSRPDHRDDQDQRDCDRPYRPRLPREVRSGHPGSHAHRRRTLRQQLPWSARLLHRGKGRQLGTSRGKESDGGHVDPWLNALPPRCELAPSTLRATHIQPPRLITQG